MSPLPVALHSFTEVVRDTEEVVMGRGPDKSPDTGLEKRFWLATVKLSGQTYFAGTYPIFHQTKNDDVLSL